MIPVNNIISDIQGMVVDSDPTVTPVIALSDTSLEETSKKGKGKEAKKVFISLLFYFQPFYLFKIRFLRSQKRVLR